MTDNRIPPSALVPASNGPLLTAGELDDKATLIIEQVLAGHLTPFEGGSLLWANAERSVIVGEVIDERMAKLNATAETTLITRERLSTLVSDALGRKLTEQVERDSGYQFAKGQAGSFAGWIRKMGASIAAKAAHRINGYERRAVAVIDGAASSHTRGPDAQHRANQIVNTAVASGRPTTLALDSGHDDPCDIVVRHDDLGSLNAADWCDVHAVARKEVPNAHKPLVDAMIYLRSQGIETPDRPMHPDDRYRVKAMPDRPEVAAACVAVLQEKALDAAEDGEAMRAQPDPEHLVGPDAELFRALWAPLSPESAKFLAGHPDRAQWVANRLTLDRPNRGVGPTSKMHTLARRAIRRASLNPVQAQAVATLVDSYIATETEPYPQRWRAGTEAERQHLRERHGRLRRSFGLKIAKVASLEGQPLGDEAKILRWLHDMALATGVIDADPFATNVDLDRVIGRVMGLTA